MVDIGSWLCMCLFLSIIDSANCIIMMCISLQVCIMVCMRE